MNLSDFGCFSFSGGERHFELNKDAYDKIVGSRGEIRAPICSSDDLMDLMLATSWLTRHGLKPFHLTIPYFPYARQDRATTKMSPFSLDVAAYLVNGLSYSRINVYEPHSDVTPGLLRAEVLGCERVCAQVLQTILEKCDPEDPLVLVSPDAGAAKRVDRCLNYIKTATVGWVAGGVEDFTVQVCKKRDPATGRLQIENIYGGVQNDGHYLIVDDICDGGATFIQLARHLRQDFNTSKIHLFVAHGIFSKGFDVLFDAGIDTIHYTDSRDPVPLQSAEVSSCGRIYKYPCGL